MNDFIRLPPDERRLYYEQASAKLNLPPGVIEKDFWVCWILDVLFNTPGWKDNLTFKGGTSLSKVWKLIHRFSEDVDVTVSRSFLGFDGDADPETAQTSSQRRKRLKKLRKVAREKVEQELLSVVQSAVVESIPEGDSAQAQLDESDRDNVTVNFAYPRVTESRDAGSMLRYVKIELGPRGDTWPQDDHFITPYLEEALPGTLGSSRVRVRALDAERTFLEKAMLLHEETFRPADKHKKARMARHYYDLCCLIEAGVGARAITDHKLFERVRKQRSFYFPVTWVDYSTLQPGSLRLVPAESAVDDWRADYDAMRDQFFTDQPPPFEELMLRVQAFQDQWNGPGA